VIRCKCCGLEMAMNLSMTFDEQTEKGCPRCTWEKCGPGTDWFTGWTLRPAEEFREHFNRQRAEYLESDASKT